jgi:hypothetical protein
VALHERRLPPHHHSLSLSVHQPPVLVIVLHRTAQVLCVDSLAGWALSLADRACRPTGEARGAGGRRRVSAKRKSKSSANANTKVSGVAHPASAPPAHPTQEARAALLCGASHTRRQYCPLRPGRARAPPPLHAGGGGWQTRSKGNGRAGDSCVRCIHLWPTKQCFY